MLISASEVFERAIIAFGIDAACEWFGYSKDDPFTKEVHDVLKERYSLCDEAAQEQAK